MYLHRLRVTALHSSGCRATVESLSSVHSSSTVAEATSLDAMSAKFKAFSFPVIKSYSVVPVFRSSVIPRFPVSRGKSTLDSDNTITTVRGLP